MTNRPKKKPRSAPPKIRRVTYEEWLTMYFYGPWRFLEPYRDDAVELAS